MNRNAVRSRAAWTAVLLAAALTGCGWEPPGRVLLIGIDGATMKIAGPMLESGRLPNLKRIADAGASGKLRSFKPLYSPRIWNSIATGKTPDKHGILGFTFRDEQDVQRLYTGLHRKALPLWGIVSDAGGVVGVINWWNTYPPEIVRGVVISDHAKPQSRSELRKLTGAEADSDEGETVFPAQWQERVRKAFEQHESASEIGDPFEPFDQLPKWTRLDKLSERFYEDSAAVRMALEVESVTQPDLLMVFMPGIDRVSHHLWAAFAPVELYPTGMRLNPEQKQLAGDLLRRYYEYADSLIGLLLARFGEKDLVIVVSDHGFEAGMNLGTLTGIHASEAARDGVMFASGPGVAAGSNTAGTTVNDVTPTILGWFGLPIGEDMDGKPAAFLQISRFNTVSTYGVEDVKHLGGEASGREADILEQLRGLGYIE